MEHYPLEIIEEQRANLLHLAEYLDTGVTELEFEMGQFCTGGGNAIEPMRAHCGTAACAVGHGPLIGIGAQPDEWWRDYADRAFGRDIFVWAFSQSWSETDNTARGAAARIFYALENGIPCNALAQARAHAPLSYTIPPHPRVSITEITARVEARKTMEAV